MMREKHCLVLEFLLLTILGASHQVTVEGPSLDYYTAAVVEFSPSYEWNNGTLTLRGNTDTYIEYIEKASKQNADIIVFPEDGLTSLHMPDRSRMDPWATVVPSADDEYVPCVENGIIVSETLKRLSCAARQNRIYVLVNIAEKRLCDREDGSRRNATRYHNTNVVFDRTGKIIARYRKVNLYMEARFDAPDTPDSVTFQTDFGVTFGTFTCFDILFPVPGLTLTRNQAISNIIFTTAWFSEVPFLTAIQTQFGWSYSEDVNLLAAGYHDPKIGSAGSGIYLGRNGIANVTMTRDPRHRLLVSRVPKTTTTANRRRPERECRREGNKWRLINYKSDKKHTSQPNQKGQHKVADWLRLMQDNVESFHSVPLNVSFTETLCHDNFCCDFHVRIRPSNADRSSSINYRAVVYNGVRLYGTEVEAGVRLCGLIQCTDDTIRSCGYAGESNGVTFTAVNVAAKFHDYPELLVMPSVLDASLTPFEHWTYTESPSANQTVLSLVLTKPKRDLVTFGIYARDFSKDKWNRSI